jgi:DNA-binding XRE family transcriptional regulator
MGAKMRPDELKALRKAIGMSQQELADRIGLSRETVGLMERGQAPIEVRTALAVRWIALNTTWAEEGNQGASAAME